MLPLTRTAPVTRIVSPAFSFCVTYITPAVTVQCVAPSATRTVGTHAPARNHSNRTPSSAHDTHRARETAPRAPKSPTRYKHLHKAHQTLTRPHSVSLRTHTEQTNSAHLVCVLMCDIHHTNAYLAPPRA